jgi:hypothetical protein
LKKQWWKTGWTTAALLVLLNSSGTVYAEDTGMTWGVNRYNNDLNITRVHCYGQVGPNRGPCDPYQGDTSCSDKLPVLCVKVDGSPRPPYAIPTCSSCAMNDEYYNGWAEGIIGLTAPVQGDTFATLDDVNAYCEAQFGPGYRVAEHHDGRLVYGMDEKNFYDATWPLTTSSGGWGFYAPGQLPDNSRFWVHINDQNANCWGSYATPKGSIGDQIWADPDEDGNGLLDGDDYPLAGVNMLLYDSGGNLVRETETYVNGKYLFSNLDYGTYSVEIDQTSLPSNMQGNVAYAPAASVTIDASNPNNKGQDFAVYVVAEPREGMTWGVASHDDSDLDISRVHCYGQPGSPCDPYHGDTSCFTPLPVLCVNVDGRPRPSYSIPVCGSSCSMNDEFYNGWIEGSVALTAPVQGNAFATLADVNSYCEAQLGPSYRAAEFHDGRWVYGMDENNFYGSTWPANTSAGGWGFYAPGQLADASRFWVDINDQNANCWSRTAATTWSLSVNSSGASDVAITSSPSAYSGTTNYSKPNIADGSIITLTAPAAGSASTSFSSWSGCDATDASARTCTISMSANKAVTANFVLNSYTVTPSAGANGSVSPNSDQTVNQGDTTSFTLTPDTGYGIDTVEGCNGSLNGNVYTTGAITNDCAVTASFITAYPVIPKARRHGSISPATTQQIAEGHTASFTVTPDAGYSIRTVHGCSGTLSGNTYTTAPITGKCKVIALFKKNPTVTVKAWRHGSITPSGKQTVDIGIVLSFTVTPDTGYRIGRVRGCGGTLSGNIYTTAPITRKCRIIAAFRKN